ncbi:MULTISPECIES: ribonuclease III [Acidiphilium]|uniref:Ribonuclease 3 n=1 Tax=Acidiphilium multivorum (strain DSM 11245 / JCM 8867 / NBRC 100883 / AIU 301) TaxID=926570 RepID=F0J238_ACIMA|nr:MULTISPECIES: ribonuclease III [Acidiphilium]MBS3023334.1 ribonuclease III [Acidiphilium multivorum]MBU6356677.1 ribonuclease III [Rhodospirillales bacterium]BAJ79624.1 ribonuclease III [Acidiphilium multivorum AIU301]GAN72430.1 ribonuclease III [Acidiphilium multivorum AIU301]
MSEAAEALLGHRFARPDLLAQALTHRSAVGQGGLGSNERLEFIGDRVLGLLIAEWLIERFPHEREGGLGPRLAHLVSRQSLAEIAEHGGIAGLLSVSPGESRRGVRNRATVLADALEALIGALYLDGGLEPARLFIRRIFAPRIDGQPSAPPKDPKTALQEYALARGPVLPAYELVERTGPSHAPRFRIRVTVAGRAAEGLAGTKREAEQNAARDLLEQLQ